ncbi:MAG TPA: hypothetical protein VIC85_15570 [Ktedonobacterales bacterium]
MNPRPLKPWRPPLANVRGPGVDGAGAFWAWSALNGFLAAPACRQAGLGAGRGWRAPRR